MTRMKRSFDVIFSLLGLVILAPVLAAIALAVRHKDGGAVVHRAMRVGFRGEPFCLYKFRTMVPNAAALGGPLTVGTDTRITRVGKMLRRWKLDELPQLFNVLRGDMSLVGPRPEAVEIAADYTADQRRIFDLVPGITDPASIRFVDENALLAGVPDPDSYYLRTIVPEKVRLNLEYAARATMFSDSATILRTLWRLGRSS